jgi:plasmid maintenance system antidote protein VapI
MLTTVQILDQLKDRLGSDYKTAKALGIPQQRISKIRNAFGILTDEQGLKAAEILGLQEEFVLLSLTAERSKTSPAYSILKRIADKFEPKAAAAAVAFSIVLATYLTAPVLPYFA